MPRAVFQGAERFIPKGTLSLPILRAASQACRGCDLYKRATQAVFGAVRQGGAGRSMMLIGEQPGDQEDRAGEPFVGPAGKLLDKALAEAGVDRARVYVTNAVKHFKWTPAPRGKRRIHSKPTLGEVAACRPWLEHELLLVQPQVIVLLGATAGQSLFGGGFRVGVLRGKPVAPTPEVAALVGKAKVIATVHPSSLLRQQTSEDREREYKLFVKDLRKAVLLLAGKA